MTSIDRRILLRAMAMASGVGLLAGCSRPTGSGQGSSAPSSTFDPVGAVAPDAREVLSVISGSFEQLTGPGRPFAFGLVGLDNKPVTGARVHVWAVPASTGQPTGPYPATFHEVPDQALGVYLAHVNLTTAAPTAFVAVTADQRAGSDIVQVATPETSKLPVPGSPAIAVATPTTSDPMGVAQLCTRKPPCGMHETSLDDALGAGRPMMLTFATPAYCQTQVCGPSVDVLEAVRTSRDWGQTAFIHVEIYHDAGQTPSEPVKQWRLQSEPWLFSINRNGMITGRADGPLLTLSEQVARMAAQLT
jgi:hypothetical protein